jgi:C_GCAxxG_C_C family probable redox protein
LNNKEKIEEIKQRARKNYSRGYNCAECVFEAVLELADTGLPKEVQRLATGLGGGIGVFGGTCGAITGAVLSVGAFYGRKGLPEGADRKDTLKKAINQVYGKPGIYRIFNQIPYKMEKKYSHTLCRELTKDWQDSWHSREKALFCRELITDAAQIAGELIFGDEKKIASEPFGFAVKRKA